MLVLIWWLGGLFADYKEGEMAKKRWLVSGMVIVVFCFGFVRYLEGGEMEKKIALPSPTGKGKVSLEEVLTRRRSRRAYKAQALTLAEVSQLLWAAQGITASWGGRTTPSAGATFPLEVYLVAGEVVGLSPGLYHYQPSAHSLVKIRDGDLRKELSGAALGQEMIETAPVTMVIVAVYQRTTKRYRERGVRYVHMEVGHCGQNIYLQAEAMGMGTVAVGAFSDQMVKEILKIKEEPLYLMPVGYPF